MTQIETIKISKEAEALSKEIKEKLSACKDKKNRAKESWKHVSKNMSAIRKILKEGKNSNLKESTIKAFEQMVAIMTSIKDFIPSLCSFDDSESSEKKFKSLGTLLCSIVASISKQDLTDQVQCDKLMPIILSISKSTEEKGVKAFKVAVDKMNKKKDGKGVKRKRDTKKKQTPKKKKKKDE